MRRLDQGYTAEVDLINKDDWNRLMLHFKDASFYQTWSFGVFHYGEKIMSHVVLKKEKMVVALAQARIVKVPWLPTGIAYISWGPMYRSKNGDNEEQHFRNMIRALYNEFVVRRKFFLRIIPHIVNIEGNAIIKDIFADEGYSWSDLPGQNVIIDLSPSLEEIRQNMHHKWRQTLRAAEKKNQEIIEGSDSEICRSALKVIRDMKSRKQFIGGNQDEILKVHMDLPEALKLKILVCLDEKEPIATLGWVTFGTLGIPLVGATGNKALKTKSSYVLWWRMIEDYKNHGFIAIDIGAVNQKRNPGGYFFKTHILGKVFVEKTKYIGQFDACTKPFLKAFFYGLFQIREIFRDFQSKL